MNVLKSAPTGISVGSYMSNAAPTKIDSKDIYTTNSAQIVDNTGANSSNGNIVALASGHNTYGSMWSTNQSFDINKKQTISAWLYFGSGNEDTSDINSEGIAFVLQNDSNGVGALGAGLEGMGVYGYDASGYNLFTGSNATQSYIQKTAIQNSVALEFDTANNSFYLPTAPINNNSGLFTGSGLGSYFSLDGYDTQLSTLPSSSLGFGSDAKYGAGGGYGHIALTYPGFADSYYSTVFSGAAVSAYSPWTAGYVLMHKSSKEAYLIDTEDQNGSPLYWHHVTINWTPAASGSTTGTLSYNFNDKNLDYSDNTLTSGYSVPFSKSIDVDTSKLNTTDGKVRWGFTAANGPSTSVASKLVAFDSIPDLLNSDADANIVDTTLNNKEITDTSTDNTVANGDSLKLNYNLNYLNGNVDWQDIAAKIKIPDDVTLTPDASNNIATITYGDGTTETISANELVDNSLQHTLAKKIGETTDASGKTAQITINAKAVNNTTSDINVSRAVATFSGSNSIASTNSPAFTILTTPQYTLDLANANSSDEIDLLYKQDNATLDLPTTLDYSDNHSFGDTTSSTNIVYQITAGDKTYTVGSSATGTSFNQTIDLKSLINDDTAFWNLFTLGSTNKVTVKAIDTTNGLVSNTITYNVVTQQNESLSMEVSKSLEFKDINYGDSTEYLPRKNAFDLSVTSFREPWQLNVTTNGLYLNGETLNENMALVYKKNSSSQYNTLSTTPTLIDEDTSSPDTDTTTDISDNWTNSTGLLLKQLGLSTAGQYTGTLTWTVSDSVNNT
ncbi:hypothetical protein ACFQAV_11015 [Companilactobacillus huachuanensis]|uniref:Cell surface protein n=1 Tax=Companilactobacillus huachuanensis TaxID=2559914 RepID=A0ABW1RMP1_9LACO|nr:hypothetical protein [Companilactobacillus huachuanensis]